MFIAWCLQEHLKLMLHSISILPHQRWKACISCLSSHWGRSKLHMWENTKYITTCSRSTLELSNCKLYST
jgi:hypothetical protein